MNSWRKRVAEYVELRRSLGFKLLDANVGLIGFASFLQERRAVRITIPLAMEWAQQDGMHAPRNGPGASVLYADLRATGVLMIRKPRCRPPAYCLTGPGGRARTYTATMRFRNCFRPRGGYHRLTACGVPPIIACWACWP